MSEVIQDAQAGFWQPPSPSALPESEAQNLPSMAEVCSRCGTEFLLGSRFCYSCGTRRPEAISPRARADAAAIAGSWENAVGRVQSWLNGLGELQFPSWLRYLHFDEIKSRLGLPTASLIAFLVGLGCVAGALLVGLLNAKTLVQWQAIQFYRAEWLLGATAAFVAGILLKKPSSN